ncbi:YjiH family protein [Echinimonas agarilytica]|uniref:YjiH family protein n=1 Tax=Echinimonas agarilytica TaxID=1215918 RepID=A0AA41W6L3_9GAMM|nr:YjiH family protein [Echinimonas agarilytica]MCM2679514.1 YjiH family protein [Echinimonas agarilytica]
MQASETNRPIRSWRNILIFLIPSFIGVALFMVPVPVEDGLTIPIAILAEHIKALLGDSMSSVITSVVVIATLASVFTKLVAPNWVTRDPFLNALLNVSPVWFVVRLLGAAFILMTYFQIGPVEIYGDDTGALVLHELMPVLLAVFMLAGLLLPLLLNFGLLELFGTLLTKIMRPIFGLPGRSAIDCMASWLGDGSVGILMTSKQYEAKFYTQREAAVIGTTFSAVSITFCLVVIAQVKLEYLFVPFYLTVCAAGFAAAVIVPKLPPLRWKKDCYIDESPRTADHEMIPQNHHVLSWGLEQALTKASHIKSVRQVIGEGLKNAVDMVFGVLPVVMAIGTVALMIATYTEIFEYLGKPFLPLLELMQIPEAEAASKTIMVGFADMFIPSILASSIESELTRFVIAAMSVTQLIYMSEVGALLLGSKIPVKLWELFVIFVLRTLVTLPVICLMAHLIL